MMSVEGVDILREAKEKGLYVPLVAQLTKDFSRANVEMNFDPGSKPEEMMSAVHEKLYQLLMEQFSEYLNVLYMVDVREHAFRQVALTDAVEVSEAVSVLVIKREWEKIQMKRKSG